MTTPTLPQEIQLRLQKDAVAYLDKHKKDGTGIAYYDGAATEVVRALPLIEFLENLQMGRINLDQANELIDKIIIEYNKP